MAGIFNQPGYLRVLEEGDITVADKARGLITRLNAAPDIRLVEANSQPKSKSSLVTHLEKSSLGYIQQGESGPGLIAAVTETLSRISAAPNVHSESGFNSEILTQSWNNMNLAPQLSIGELKRRAVKAAKVAAAAELAQKNAINDAVRVFERRQARKDGKHKAHVEYATEKGYQRGQNDNQRSENASQKVNVVVGTIAEKAGSIGQSVKYTAADFKDSFVTRAKEVRERLKTRFSKSGDVVDAEFIKE